MWLIDGLPVSNNRTCLGSAGGSVAPTATAEHSTFVLPYTKRCTIVKDNMRGAHPLAWVEVF
jgi:hypothetical protein